jgi:hypothetical protein
LELLENKNLKFNGSFILENPFYPPIGKIPTIRGEVKELLINTDGIRVPFQVMIDKWGKGSLILTNRSGETFLDSINFLFNFGVLDVLLDQMPFSRSGQFKLKGKISFLEKGFYPEISLKTKNLNVFYKNMKIPVFILGNIQGKNYNLKNQLRIFDGFIQSEIMGIINWENLSNPFGKTKINTKVTSLKLKLPAKKEKSDKETDFKYPIPKFPLEIDMELEKVNLEKIVLNGNGHLSTRKGGTSNLKMNLTFNDAPALIKAKLLKSKKNAHLDFKLKKFDLSDLENLLPKKLGNFTGKANLEFFGTFPFPSIKLKDFSFQVKFDAFNGNYNNPHLGENWEKFIKENEGLEKYISKDAQPFVDYERIHLIGEIKSGKILIDKFIFRAPEEKLLIHANGHLGIKEDTRSLVYLDFRDKMGITLPSLKKLFGMETLYFKLEGKGFKLKPDLVYTSSKVLQNIPIELPKTLLSPIDKLLIDPFRKKPKPENEKK